MIAKKKKMNGSVLRDLVRPAAVRCIGVLLVLAGVFPNHHHHCSALHLLPQIKFPSPSAARNFGGGNNKKAAEIEAKLLDAIDENQEGRLSNSEEIAGLIDNLESLYDTSASVKKPAIAPEIYGRWRLLYTTNADTGSPIQRKAVDASKFPIFQDIVFVDDEDGNEPAKLLVKQIVKFGDGAELSVDALASTAAYPLAELVDKKRKTTGKVLGINVLGVSLVGDEAEPDPAKPNSRIDFVFDEGNFFLGDNLKIPYPVPFRLPILRDWVKGWIDITYLGSNGAGGGSGPLLRISRGNKGTTFVLVKEE